MKSFSIANIKSFKNETGIEIKPITILVGKNSSGKSSLIRFPVVFAQTNAEVNSLPLHLYGRMIDYGTFDDVIYNHSGNEIFYSLKYDYAISLAKLASYKKFIEDKPVILKTLEIKTHLGIIDNQLTITHQSIVFDDKCIYEYFKDDNNETFRVLGSYDFEKQAFDDVNFELSQEKKDDVLDGIFQLLPGSKSLKKMINNAYFQNNNVDYDDKQKQSLIEEMLFSKTNNDYIKEVRKNIKTSTGDTFLEEKIASEAFISRLDNSNDSDNNLYINIFRHELLNKLDKESRITYKDVKYWYIYNSFSFIVNFIGEINYLIRRESYGFSYLGPFRQEPERIYRYSGAYMKEVGVKGENVNNILIFDSQSCDAQLIDSVSEWLKKSLGYKLLAQKVANGYYQLLLEDQNGVKANITDVGYGISQILPIVTQIMLNKPHNRRDGIDDIRTDITVIEQPELHLHPAAQAELADLFAACVNENTNQRLLIETHSEHFIRKLQVLVADKTNKLASDDVAIYYIDKNDEGEAYIDKLNLLPNGQFEKEWPTGFFDKALELSMDLIKKNSEA